ncbi:MAG: LysR substrate-binding domain-containing protein [Kiloniellales bacterium]|nr:LysR substrate-binding domain-containing protein [Kiloniellales bacterium]
MNFLQLRAFHGVASAGSFTRAAERLHVTQPTLSGQVKDLEQGFGVKLFERRGRGVATTELGGRLLTITRQIFGLEAEAEQLLSGARALTRGRLRIGADAPFLVLPLMAALQRRFPGIDLAVAFGNSQEVLRSLVEGRNDVAILPDVAKEPRLHAQAFRRDRLVVFVERGHPWARRRSVHLRDLAEERLLLREVGSTTRAILERALRRARVRPSETLEIGSREAVREAAAAGLGVGVVAESEFGHDDRLHKLEIRGGAVQATEYAVCLKAKREDRAVAAFFEVLADSAPG